MDIEMKCMLLLNIELLEIMARKLDLMSGVELYCTYSSLLAREQSFSWRNISFLSITR